MGGEEVLKGLLEPKEPNRRGRIALVSTDQEPFGILVVPHIWITPLVPNTDPSTLSPAAVDPDAVAHV